jgi:catechol 2,3-dioxygenase-like lactoylglutathione lyase family enzyme
MNAAICSLRSVTVSALALTVLLFNFTSLADEDDKVFSKPTIELGIVVADLEKSAKFYAEVVGMTEVKGFSAPAQVATKFGLTDNQAITVRKFVIADVEGAPALKLMAFTEAQGVKPDQKFIHSTLGFSYLTLFVVDMGAAVERAEKAGVKMLGETPAKAGPKNYLTVFQDPDGNFIELIGPSKTELGEAAKKNASGGELSFWAAARIGNVDVLKKHLAAGQDIDEKQNGNAHAIGIAALFGQTRALEYLISAGGNVNIQTNDGGTALHGASYLGRTDIIEILLKAEADVNIKNSQGVTPLDECSDPWSSEIEEKVAFLNEKLGLDRDPKEVREGRPKVLALLKKQGAKPGSEVE